MAATDSVFFKTPDKIPDTVTKRRLCIVKGNLPEDYLPQNIRICLFGDLRMPSFYDIRKIAVDQIKDLPFEQVKIPYLLRP